MPTNLAELFTLEYLKAHWVGILVFAIVAGLLLYRWSKAGQESAEGPVVYAKKKHQVVLFVIGILTLVALVLIIAFAGPSLGRFIIWGFTHGVDNTEKVLMSDEVATKESTTGGSDSHGASSTPTTAITPIPDGQIACFTINSDATARVEPNSTAAASGDGSIEAGLVVKVDKVVESNLVGNSNQRARLAEAAGGVPAGGWFHLSVASPATCP